MKRLLGLIIFGVLSVGIILAADDGVAAKDKPAVGSKPSGTKPSTTKSFSAGDNKPKPPPTKSFGSGDKPKPPPITPVVPPKKSFGSGDAPKPTPKDTHVTPPTTGPPKKTFGSGDKPKVEPKVEPPKKTFGSGDKPVTPPKDVGTKPTNKTGFDSKAAAAQKKEESKAAFTKGKTPAASYVDPKGKTVAIDPRDAKIASLRNQLSAEKWHNRDLRERNFYATYYSRPVVVYHDPYGSFFWYWMLDRSIEQQALWAYHHRASMDAARYNDMIARNAELAARVRALETARTPVNPAYQPADMADADLMYNKNYVQAAYNPEPVPVATTRPVATDDGSALKVLLYVFLGLGIIALIVWLVFVKKW